MIVDKETFTEIVLELKQASDMLLDLAHGLAILSDNPQDPDQLWPTAVKSLMQLNRNIYTMEGLLRSVLGANSEEKQDGGSPSC